MAELARLTRKDVRVGIKKGLTMKVFCEKYQCSEEELKARIEQLYSKDTKVAKKCLDEIMANGKKPKKQPKPIAEEVTIQVEAEEIPETSGFESTTELVNADETSTDTEINKLEVLKDLEESVSQEVIDLESSNKALVREYHICKTKLDECNKKLDEITEEYLACNKVFNETIEEAEKIEQQRSELKKQWGVKRKVLGDIRAEIERLSTIGIDVYNSGEIAPTEGCEVELDDSGWEGLRESLLTSEYCQDLRLRDIGVLARLLKINEHAGGKITLLCDRSEIENAFKALCNK